MPYLPNQSGTAAIAGVTPLWGRTSYGLSCAASAASFSIPAQSFASTSFFGAIHEPPTVMTLESFR